MKGWLVSLGVGLLGGMRDILMVKAGGRKEQCRERNKQGTNILGALAVSSLLGFCKCDSDGNYNLRRQPSPAGIEINMHPDGLTGFLDLQSQFRLVSSPHVKKKASQIAFWAMLNPVIFLRGTNPSTKPDGFLQSESKVKVFIANFPTH